MDGVVGLDGLTIQAHCLSGYSPSQPLAQLFPNQRAILWLTLENWNAARTRNYYWRDTPIGEGTGGGGAPRACALPSFHKLLYKLLTTLCVVSNCAPPINFLRL